MQKAGARCVAVVEMDGRFQGYITLENIAELVMINAAFQKPKA